MTRILKQRVASVKPNLDRGWQGEDVCWANDPSPVGGWQGEDVCWANDPSPVEILAQMSNLPTVLNTKIELNYGQLRRLSITQFPECCVRRQSEEISHKL